MTIEHQRQEYDRRQRAWVYIVIGLLVAWLSLSGFSAETLVWNVVGYVAFLAGLASVTFGVILFQKRRP